MSRVLILTDDAPFAALGEQSLRDHAHAVRVSSLARFDIERAREFGADLIVLDTDGNGGAISVRQRILRDRSFASLPLLAVTENVAEAQLLSAQGMVTKPVAPSTLQQLVQKLAVVQFPI